MSEPKKVLLAFAGAATRFFPELPLSVLYIASALQQKGHPVEIIDLRVQDFRSLTQGDYLFAGVSSMTGTAIRAGLAFAEHMRGLNPKLPIVWGGVHVSLLPEQALANSLVDIVVRGEGEITVQALAQALQTGMSLVGIEGLSFKQSGQMVHNPDRAFMDMNEIAIALPYELVDMTKYNLETFPIHTSRGCPFRCGFCYNLAFNQRRWRHKRAERVLDEIAYVVQRFGSRKISFVSEDEFFIDVARVKAICEGLLARGIQIQWESFCRFNSFRKVDDALLALLEKAGCTCLSFGAESGSQRILDEVIQKDIQLEWVLQATERLARTQITQVVSFMSGLPTETDEDMAKSFQLIDRLARMNPKIYFIGLVLYTPYPGTPLFDTVVRDYAYQCPKSLEQWADFGIYREVGTTWHDRRYLKKYKLVSIITRFPFWKEKFSLASIQDVIAGSRFTRFPFNVFYWLLTRDARWRWQHRFFKLGPEFWVLEKLLMKIRGFV